MRDRLLTKILLGKQSSNRANVGTVQIYVHRRLITHNDRFDTKLILPIIGLRKRHIQYWASWYLRIT